MSSRGHAPSIARSPLAYLIGVILLACGNSAWSVLPEAGASGVRHQAVTSTPASSKAGAIRWDALTSAQRTALAPLQKDWSALDNTSQEKWLALANRFPSMSQAERERVQARMTEWARTPSSERGMARLRFQHAKEISPEQRQAQWTAYQNLPEDQRRKLADDATKKQKLQAQLAASGAAPSGQKLAGGSDQGTAAKSNIVPSPKRSEAAQKSIAPTIVQANPGATTTLISKRPTPAPHLQPGLPKVAATPGLVDSATLLPRQGPQGIKAPATESGASGASPAHPKKS